MIADIQSSPAEQRLDLRIFQRPDSGENYTLNVQDTQRRADCPSMSNESFKSLAGVVFFCPYLCSMDDSAKILSGIPVMETFYTVQGEGAFAGAPAYFIRTGGCDVGCVWCDVKESWDASKHPSYAVSQLVKNCKDSGTGICIITGGEPMMYNLDELTTSIKDSGIRAHMETSGTHPLTGQWDWVTFSPKKFMKPLEEYYSVANELKVIVFHPSDLAWAEEHAQKVNKDCLLYLQPEWEKRETMIPLILDYIRKNTRWRISLQTHKWIGVE
jgi:organic radical activating enzyme